MHVKHGLARVPVGVEDRPESARRDAPLARDGGRTPHNFSNNRIVAGAEIVERGDVLFRNHEHVRRPLRVDVVEREHTIVLVDDRRRDLMFDDLAEEAV